MSLPHDAAAVTSDYLEGLLEGFVAYDGDWRMTYMNAAAERILGRRRADVLGKRWHEAFPHAVGSPVDQMYQRVMRERVAERMEYFYAHYGRWMEISASPVRTGGVGVYFRDITSLKSAERALRESEERFRVLADSAPVLIWVNGPEGCEYVNRTYLEFAGIGEEQAARFAWADLVHPEDRERYVERYVQAAAARGPFEERARLRRRDGEYRWMRSVGLPRFSARGEWLGYVGTTMDITDMQAAEDRLREADRRKDEFLAMLAHELRNPLAPIHSALQLLRIADKDAEAAHQARQIMERQIGHLVRLVDDLMEVSRISSGKIELQKEPVDLAEVIGSAVETSRPLIDAARHRLRVELPREALQVDADSVRLAQVLANLLNNAAKYTPEGGDIVLAVRREGSQAVVSVRDNGLGLEPRMLEKAFDMFAQGVPTRTQGGLGIGLALARMLVQMHDGSIEARSAGPGLGSEFVVRLPAKEARPPLPTPRPGRCSLGGKGPRRILVVDDNRDAAISLGLLLRANGHEVHIAHDGAAGLEAARSRAPDMILLDISMPGIDGLSVARHLRLDPRLEPVPIIAITGLGQEEDRRRTREAGFDEHLVKPVSPERLRDVLERF